MLLTTRNSRADYVDAAMRVYDNAGNVIEMREHEGEFKVKGGMYLRPAEP